MKKATLDKARLLEGDIWQAEDALKGVNDLLVDYENFGSTISFKRNSDSYSRSFGSKKFNFKEDLRKILLKMRYEIESEILQLKKQFDEL